MSGTLRINSRSEYCHPLSPDWFCSIILVPGDHKLAAEQRDDTKGSAEEAMAEYVVDVSWERGDAAFVDGRYSRAHSWHFDGGVTVPASSSTHVVPAPYSLAANVDPEEAFVAALSSCHMLTFLSIAAKRGFVVDRYADHAAGVLARNQAGRLSMTRVALHPHVRFAGARLPLEEEVRAMHHAAHEECFIANSVHTVVEADPTWEIAAQ
jgi:organic hydroperoxide reductase OsmC/OhrA